MKRIASLAMSTMLVLSLTACGSQSTVTPALQDTQVEAQAAKQTTLSMKKDSTKTEKKASNNIKELNIKIADKKSSSVTKTAEDLVVKFSKTTAKNDMDSANIAMIARYSLTSMNQARTYEDGYRIGIAALEQMARNNVYVARVSWSAGNSAKTWENGFKIVSAALNHIAAEKPNNAYEACNLVMSMMGAANTWEDGYKAGYAALQIIGQTDNYTIKSIVSLALNQANNTSTYDAGFNVLKNALQELRRANI